MANFNKVILMGNLTRDPEVRFTPSGMAVTELDMAINRRYKKNDGQLGEETCYVNRITVWGRQAESCGQYLKRGAPVMVEGRLKYDQWEKDGQKHSRLGVVAERVQFLSSPSRGTEFKDGAVSPPVAEPQSYGNNSSGGANEQQPPPVAQDLGAPSSDPVNDDEDNLPF